MSENQSITSPSSSIDTDVTDIEWRITSGLTDYEMAVGVMEERVKAIHEQTAPEMIWLLEHPPLYTAGTSAKAGDLLENRFPVYRAARGGEYTYHGPGQRVVYVMLDLKKRGRDVRKFVNTLEDWIITTLDQFNIRSERREGRVGVWVDRTEPGGARREDKIAAIGIRIRRWVSFHGIAINVEPDLSHFEGIVPCGIAEPGLGVTSMVDLGLPITIDDLDPILKETFGTVFAHNSPDAAAVGHDNNPQLG